MQNITNYLGSNPRIMLLALHFRYLESSVQTKIWLKTKRNLLVISCSSSKNLSLVRMHEFVAREFSLLRSQNPSVWVSTSSMRAVQADIEDPQESRDRKPWRNSPGYWKQSWVQGRTLKCRTTPHAPSVKVRKLPSCNLKAPITAA